MSEKLNTLGTTVDNPLVIRCNNCGGELGFDIVKQQYVCAHCGMTLEQDSRKAEFKNWKSTHQHNLQQQLSQAKLFCCPACGAKTMTSSEEATARCPFCGNTLIDDTFSDTELPETIIPFQITLQEAHARLKEWVKSNPKQPVAKEIEQHLNKLVGCYLPFHVVRGCFDGKLYLMKQGATETEHIFKAYLKSVTVNASQELNNLFLDGIEPFDFNQAKVFEFSYLNQQKAKIQNTDSKEMNQRITEEVEVELIRTLSKKLFNKRITLYLLDDDNESASTLLPVYILNCGNGISAAVNGQTGKISIMTGKEIKLIKRWWLVPSLITVLTVILGFYLDDIRLYLIATAFLIATIIGAIDTQFKKKTIKEILTSPNTKQSHNDTQVQFFKVLVDKWNPRYTKKIPVSRMRVLLSHLFA